MSQAAEAVIRSRSNPVFKRLKAQKERTDRELVLLEGPKLLEEALGAGIVVREVLCSQRAERSHHRSHRVLAEARARGVQVLLLDEALIDSLSEAETSQGVLALAERPRFDEERVFAGVPLIVVAVGIQNPGNLGALLRTAEAAGASGALLTSGCADPFAWKALRGSMGSAFRLPHVAGLSAPAALTRLREHGVMSVAAVKSGGRPYDRFDWRRPAALLLGNEGEGLPAELEAAAEARVAIPMAGPVESLNVTAAAAVLLFEAARRRRG
jgi:TrmH family RNA methyltransferase